ncbi:MAG: rhomboid family intramembrane serine protease [Hamadaea sp.]|uniref:rhomboid family intramembrane serine protease n=1 Tax=Hamadaea sp. TaxID=2024425 RepID=UPI0017FC82D2|nr:rhomboid family intramembrane serine protease [Hamadaea sp.]NUT24104.1 rhomboid family intramembrane serine protease [Hamadaea sp.]
MTSVGQVPVCYRHPSRETYLSCSRCGRPICPDCMIPASVGHQCPECVREGSRNQRAAVTAFGGDARAGAHGYVTKGLIAINVAMMIIGLLMSGTGSLFGGGWGGLLGGGDSLSDWGGMIGSQAGLCHFDDGSTARCAYDVIAQGESYRFLTSIFLHAGLLHLALNMWALWVVGRVIEQALGPLRFLALYLVAGLGGSLAVYLFTGPNLTVGASGAIFGLFAALFILLRKVGRDASQLLVLIVINVVFTFTISGISIPGHLGGLATGAIAALPLAYAPQKNRALIQYGALGVMFVAIVVIALLRSLSIT